MKKKSSYIIILLLIIALSYSYIRRNTIKKYFVEERYYSVLSFLKLAKPHYKPYKNFFEIFKQEGFDYNLKNAKVIEDSINKIKKLKTLPLINKIPKVTHQVYFTPQNQQVSFGGFLIENLKLFTKNLSKYGNWTHHIWTNNPQLFEGIEYINVHDISIFKEHPLYDNLLKMLEKGNSSRAFLAEASDLIRLLALQKFGGVYKDMDYEVYNYDLFNEVLAKFDFIGGRERYNIKSYYGNSFIAAKPNHPIINKALSYMYRNNKGNNLPKYLNYPSIEFDRIYFNGPPIITLAYFSENNLSNNNDVILPPWMIYNMSLAHTLNKRCDLSNMPVTDFYQIKLSQKKIIEDFIDNFEVSKFNDGKESPELNNIYYNSAYHEEYEIIGADMFCGSWVGGNNFKHNFYWDFPFMKKHEKN